MSKRVNKVQCIFASQDAMLEHRVEATSTTVVGGIGLRLQTGDLAVAMMAAQPYF